MAEGGNTLDGGKSNKNLWIILAVVGGVLLASCACCVPVGIGLLLPAVQKVREAADRTARIEDLKELNTAIHSFHDMHKQMPANADDLKPFFDGKVTERIRNGEIAVDWNSLTVKNEKRDLRTVILAWNTQRFGQNQRLVLFMNGTVETIPEDQFLAMPKAEKNEEKK